MIRIKWTMVAKVLKLTAAIITTIVGTLQYSHARNYFNSDSLFGSNTRPAEFGRSD